MRDMLTDAGVAGERITAIIGHDQGDTTFGIYGSAFKHEHLNAAIQKLPIVDILSNVSGWKR